ncbi:YggL family protein [Achromobacter sp.]|uniref:YggL family protein n=1 Tax=Achromobacter sp. TaxID=134375 RepID=UPI000EB942B6|nr:YggL family protein [Achromobacter sp.]HCW20016.1 hypothetical protein [Achromobacter sp.]
MTRQLGATKAVPGASSCQPRPSAAAAFDSKLLPKPKMRTPSSNVPAGKRLDRLTRRQRKKLHVGEFQQFVFEVRALLKEDTSDKTLLDSLIDMIESRKLYFGGMVGQSKIDGLVSSAIGSPSDEDRQAVLDWLHKRPEVTEAKAGEFVDAWYGWN